MIEDKQKTNIEELLALIQANPDLPIVPMVDLDVAADEGNAWWMGAWGTAVVDEYIICEKRSWYKHIIFKSDDDVFDTLWRCLTSDEYDRISESEEECRLYYDALPWKKAIIVYIDAPEQEGKYGKY